MRKSYNQPEAQVKEIDLVYRTMYAELGQRSLDAAFETEFPVEGRFVTQISKDRKFWYFHQVVDGEPKRTYVGPHSDEEITGRVERFQEIKDDIRARRKLVSTLIREAGMQGPERFTGDVVQALSEAGLFRLRAVLVGTVAYQCYPALLGVRLPSAAMQTGDADFAQFHSISAAVGDSIPPVIEVMRKVDRTFREIPSQAVGRRTTQFENGSRFKVEFLTPNTGSADHDDKPASMPALGGASAQPLRFLDFLIHEPVRAVMLHRVGVPILVPAPERFAVHKLIVASRRRTDDNGLLKQGKDARQAGLLMSALCQTRRQDDLATVYTEAWERGPAWKQALAAGLTLIPNRIRDEAIEGLRSGLDGIGESPDELGLEGGARPGL